MITIGDTFYWTEGGHLWVIISDPLLHQGNCVAANLTKDEFRAKSECPIFPGEHPWVVAKTFVSFGDARRMGPKEFEKLVGQFSIGTIRTHSPATPALLEKIVQAGKVSVAIASNLKALL